MLIFLPPIVQILGGVALIGAGAATHLVILDGLGAVGTIIGAARWSRKRRDGGARR